MEQGEVGEEERSVTCWGSPHLCGSCYCYCSSTSNVSFGCCHWGTCSSMSTQGLFLACPPRGAELILPWQSLVGEGRMSFHSTLPPDALWGMVLPLLAAPAQFSDTGTTPAGERAKLVTPLRQHSGLVPTLPILVMLLVLSILLKEPSSSQQDRPQQEEKCKWKRFYFHHLMISGKLRTVKMASLLQFRSSDGLKIKPQ